MFELKRHSSALNLSVKVGEQVVPVSLDIAKQGMEFNQRFSDLAKAESELKQVSSSLFSAFSSDSKTVPDASALPSFENLEKARQVYGSSLRALLNLIFGETGTHIITTFFDNDYEDLLLSIMPFIQDDLIPALEKARDDKVKRYAKAGLR